MYVCLSVCLCPKALFRMDWREIRKEIQHSLLRSISCAKSWVANDICMNQQIAATEYMRRGNDDLPLFITWVRINFNSNQLLFKNKYLFVSVWGIGFQNGIVLIAAIDCSVVLFRHWSFREQQEHWKRNSLIVIVASYNQLEPISTKEKNLIVWVVSTLKKKRKRNRAERSVETTPQKVNVNGLQPSWLILQRYRVELIQLLM